MKLSPRLLPVAVLAVLLGTGSGAGVAQTYKIVGPDGKITFSDRKPTDPQLQARQLGQKVTAPLVTPGSQPFDLHTLTKLPPGNRAAASSEGVVPPSDISGKPFPPGLPDAVLTVLVHQFFVQTLVETCGRLRPALLDRYQAGVRNWRERNAEILTRSNQITFARFTGEQRDMLRSTARMRLAPLLPAIDAAAEDKTQWCDRMSTDLARRQFELVGDARVAPIVDFEMP